jgi:hypothetical protein
MARVKNDLVAGVERGTGCTGIHHIRFQAEGLEETSAKLALPRVAGGARLFLVGCARRNRMAVPILGWALRVTGRTRPAMLVLSVLALPGLLYALFSPDRAAIAAFMAVNARQASHGRSAR